MLCQGGLEPSLRLPQRFPVLPQLSPLPSNCGYFVHMGHSYTLFRTREATIRPRPEYSRLSLAQEQYAHCCKENMDQGRRHQTRCTVAPIIPWVFPNFQMWNYSQREHKRLACTLGKPSTRQLPELRAPDPRCVNARYNGVPVQLLRIDTPNRKLLENQ